MHRYSHQCSLLMSLVLTNLNVCSFSQVRDRGIRFDASAIFFSFFQGIFGKLRKRRVFPDKTFNTYLPLKLIITTVNHAVNRHQRLDTIEIIIACNCFSAERIDQVFNMTILVVLSSPVAKTPISSNF